MTYFQSLSAAGFAATAISFGPARMSFGLFVPEFRSAFSMSTSQVGLVASLGFAGFFVALLIAQFLLNRKGPEAPVLSGLLAATIGLGIVALAPNVGVLATGVFLAASSAGFAWTPFNDAVHRKVRDADRPAALSEVSTGTSLGIALAGMVALAMVLAGIDWRVCWAVFAVASAVALVANWAALRHVEKSPESVPREGWRDLLGIASLPLFAIAFVFGVTSAVFISFAPERFADAGGVPGMSEDAAPALVFIFYGVFGLAGLVTGRARDVIGLSWLLRVLMATGAASLALAALLPSSWIGLISSAGLQGINVMMTSAVLAFWSERLFPRFPSLGFTAALLATAAGNVVGPALAGVASSTSGASATFLGTAAMPLLVAMFIRDRWVTEQPDAADCAGKSA
ncbi:MFS transporter [Citreimonas salinaria]|uniref:Predicted arabinose efflux permease, MFS family n=1 Tax=Citreimonas salinaria TaxID=321339 RepID=A0A1H3LJI9_9RHOB|nr:MFS transporter [Citreimonas salinaria]SDY64309.1 Predicted arabinose efflux permease, MFS family [Citreimonas salinaria]